MTNKLPRRLLVSAVVCALSIAPWSMAPQAADSFDFVYLGRDGDAAYQPTKAYTGLVLRDRKRPVEGARLAVRESRIMGRARGLSFDLKEATLAPGGDAATAIRKIAGATGARVFLLDLPLGELSNAARDLATAPFILFNIRHGDDALRGPACARNLFHTLPSDAMLMDGLVQYLKQKNWQKILVLQGEELEDARLAGAFQASAKKFNLTIQEVRPFKLGNDPRDRGRNNIRLMTAALDYDAVFLADTLGEFGRYVPFQTTLARPVVGSEGLIAEAWHWTWERHGAPQLNQRFEKRAGHRMGATDWAAWAAVRAVVEAILRTEKTDVAALRAFLTSPQINLDTYKGAPGSFRPWNNQLRQPVLLHTHNAVIARAPIEGFLHQSNNLDTLGADRPETACRF